MISVNIIFKFFGEEEIELYKNCLILKWCGVICL